MKKFLTLLFTICVLLCGCSINNNFGTKNASQAQSNETISETFTTSQIEDSIISSIPQNEVTTKINSPTEEELRQLIDKNTYCNLNIFSGSLPLENKNYVFDENNTVQKVDTSVFGSYAEFEKYIRSVYCKKTADMFLYNYPYEGKPIYLNIDGDLFLNTLYSNAKGYFVDWTNYTVTINYADEMECLFKVKASAQYPGEATTPEDYIKESKAVFENGKWLLSEMIY